MVLAITVICITYDVVYYKRQTLPTLCNNDIGMGLRTVHTVGQMIVFFTYLDDFSGSVSHGQRTGVETRGGGEDE